MANDWFRFRQFLVRQDRSAMKVGTDGVLLGAWARCSDSKKILDVGTGTGLIALMMAQRCPEAIITAIELDPEAAWQASENFRSSVWSSRLRVLEGDFLDWRSPGEGRFDLIICNPPFFSRSLKNPDEQRSAARHDDGLPLAGLLLKSQTLLDGEGRVALILPAARLEEALDAGRLAGLYPMRQTGVRGHAAAPVKRILLEFGSRELPVEVTELIISTGVRGEYTGDYLNLTGEFYL